MIVYIESPEGWGPRQMLASRLEELGYTVTTIGIGETWKLYLG